MVGSDKSLNVNNILYKLKEVIKKSLVVAE